MDLNTAFFRQPINREVAAADLINALGENPTLGDYMRFCSSTVMALSVTNNAIAQAPAAANRRSARLSTTIITQATGTKRRGRPPGSTSSTTSAAVTEIVLTPMRTNVMTAVRNNPGGKIPEIAKAAGIVNDKGEPDNRKAWPVIQSLIQKAQLTGNSETGFSAAAGRASNVSTLKSSTRARRATALTGRGRRAQTTELKTGTTG